MVSGWGHIQGYIPGRRYSRLTYNRVLILLLSYQVCFFWWRTGVPGVYFPSEEWNGVKLFGVLVIRTVGSRQ